MNWTPDDWARLGRALSDARQHAGLSQRDLAEAADVSVASVQAAEAGKAPRGRMPYTIASIARELGWPAGRVTSTLDGESIKEHAEEQVEGAPALASLVRAERSRLHLSFVALSAAADDPVTGAGVTSSWLHRLESNLPVIPPQLPQLRALAAGLRVPLSRVQEAAAAQFFGMDSDGPVSAETLALAERLQQLTSEQRDALVGFLDAFQRSE